MRNTEGSDQPTNKPSLFSQLTDQPTSTDQEVRAQMAIGG